MDTRSKSLTLRITRTARYLVGGLIVLIVVGGLGSLGYVYVVKPNFVGNIVSISPSLVVQTAFDMSLNNRSMATAAHLLGKQIRYGRFLGENYQMEANVEKNAEKYLQYAILVEDFDNLMRLFEDEFLRPSTDHLKGLFLKSQVYQGQLASRQEGLSFDPNPLNETRYERYLIAWEKISRQYKHLDKRGELCDTEASNVETLRIHEFSPTVTSRGYMASSVPILFAEYWDATNNRSVLSTPGLLDYGEQEIRLSLELDIQNLSELRFHVLSRPGTMLLFKSIKLGNWKMAFKSMPFLLKNGFVLDEETIILTTPYETLLFLEEKKLPPNTQTIELDIVTSRAKGVKLVCE